MDRMRLIGLVILGLGVTILLTLENEAADFLSGLLIGGGAGVMLTGKFGKSDN